MVDVTIDLDELEKNPHATLEGVIKELAYELMREAKNCYTNEGYQIKDGAVTAIIKKVELNEIKLNPTNL